MHDTIDYRNANSCDTWVDLRALTDHDRHAGVQLSSCTLWLPLCSFLLLKCLKEDSNVAIWLLFFKICFIRLKTIHYDLWRVSVISAAYVTIKSWCLTGWLAVTWHTPSCLPSAAAAAPRSPHCVQLRAGFHEARAHTVAHVQVQRKAWTLETPQLPLRSDWDLPDVSTPSTRLLLFTFMAAQFAASAHTHVETPPPHLLMLRGHVAKPRPVSLCGG